MTLDFEWENLPSIIDNDDWSFFHEIDFGRLGFQPAKVSPSLPQLLMPISLAVLRTTTSECH